MECERKEVHMFEYNLNKLSEMEITLILRGLYANSTYLNHPDRDEENEANTHLIAKIITDCHVSIKQDEKEDGE